MSLGPNLLAGVMPYGVWVTLHEKDHADSDTRKVTLRVKPFQKRSVSASLAVSVYSPEHQLLLAVGKAVQQLEGAQCAITRDLVLQCLDVAVRAFVDPF